jgi:hypothetical protein
VKQVTQQDGSSVFFVFLCKIQQEAGGYWPTRSTTEPLFNTAHFSFQNLKSVSSKFPLFQQYRTEGEFLQQVEILTN